MSAYQISPYGTFVESRLTDPIQYAIFHRLTGQLFEIDAGFRSLLLQVKAGKEFRFEPEQASRFGIAGRHVQRLIDTGLLVEIGVDPLSSFLDLLVIKPLQNPAVTSRQGTGQLVLTRMSMAERVYSRPPNQRPEIVEEVLPERAAQLWLAADGT